MCQAAQSPSVSSLPTDIYAHVDRKDIATLGARLFTPSDSKSISLVFNAGHDFPVSVIETFRSWSIDLHVQHLPEQPSARGLVFYKKAHENRKGFQRLTEPLPVTIADLRESRLLSAQAVHFFGTAEYMQEQSKEMNNAIAEGAMPRRPFIVCEPMAQSCKPDTLEAHQQAARLVDVFSPNHEELDSFFSSTSDLAFDAREVERQAHVFVESGIGLTHNGCVVVRAAGHGCFCAWGSSTVWLPSYHDSKSEKVVDPTGAGNAFLGAFAIGWQETGSYVEAAKYGQVAASFAIEQVGLPELKGCGDGELWNGESVRQRLDRYQRMG